MNSLRRRFSYSLAWGCLAAALGMGAVDVRAAPAEESAAQLRLHLRQAQGVKVVANGRRTGAAPRVLLIGENHASTTTQKQIAGLLETLVVSQTIDAILVEGSCGDVELEEIVRNFRSDGGKVDLKGYWNELVERGDLSGYEAIALQYPTVPVAGVEDMAAKVRFQFQWAEVSAGASDLRVALDRRHAVLETALELVGEDLDPAQFADPAKLVEAHRAEIVSLVSVTRAHESAHPDLADERALATDRAAFGCDPDNKPVFAAYRKRDRKVDAYNTIVTQLQEAEARTERATTLRLLDTAAPVVKLDLFRQIEASKPRGTFDYGEIGKLHETQREVAEQQTEDAKRHYIAARLKSEVESEGSRLERQYPTFHARHAELSERAKSLPDRSEEFEAFRASSDALENRTNHVRFTYFEAANSIAALARKRWPDQVPDRIRGTLDRLDRALIDERENLEALSEARSKTELAERDAAMAERTRRYLEAKQPRLVALIVGFHHLPGMTEQLTEREIPFIAITLSGNSITAPWEERAWVERMSPGSDDDETKEETLLQSPQWIERTRKNIRRLPNLPTGAPARRVKKGAVVVTYPSAYAAELGEHLGEHVTSSGPVPGRAGVRFEEHDHGKASELIQRFESADASFFYSFEVQHEKRFIGNSGELSVGEFTRAALSKRFSVVAAAPDYVLDGAVVISPLTEVLTSIRGRGPVDPPRPPTDRPVPGADDPSDRGGPKRTRITQTINFERASRNVQTLVEQKEIRGDEVTLIDNPRDLLHAPFVQRDGKYAGMTVILARNDATLRDAVARAGEAGKLMDRQVLLITCADGMRQTRSLVAAFLDGGAVMVWRPNTQLSERAGNRLFEEIATIVRTEERKFTDMTELVEFAIQRLLEKYPEDSELGALSDRGSSWVARALVRLNSAT